MEPDTTAVGRLLQFWGVAAAIKAELQAEIVAARGDVDVPATLTAVAATCPAANLVRNAAYAVAQRLPCAPAGAISSATPAGAASLSGGSSNTRPVSVAGAAAAAAAAAADKGTSAPIDAAAAEAEAGAQEQWQKLVAGRLADLQRLLPELPLAAVPSNTDAAPHKQHIKTGGTDTDMPAWERVSSTSLPGGAALEELSSGLPLHLLFDATGLLETIVSPVTPPSSGPGQEGGTAAAGSSGGRNTTGVAASKMRQQRERERRQQARRRGTPAEGSGEEEVDSETGSNSSSGSTSGAPSTAAAASAPGAGLAAWRQTAAARAGAPPVGSLLSVVKAPRRLWLQSFFADLWADRRQVGLDDSLHPWFMSQQLGSARTAVASRSAAAARLAARTGLPPSERPAAWAAALGLAPMPGAGDSCGSGGSGGGSGEWAGPYRMSKRDEDVLRVLCEGAEAQPLLVDAVTWADAATAVGASEHYFPFVDSVRAILLAFSRDASVCRSAQVPPLPRFAVEGRGGQLRTYPPSGLFPFRGLAALAAPLAFLYDSPPAAYRVFSALYARHWCGLHALSVRGAPAAAMPTLCRTFVDLLEEADPAVVRHLDAIGLPALEVAFPWMLSAFSGYLSPAETLLLWDRIIGFDSLLPLPLLAAAVVTFRRDLILSAAGPDELVEVMEDLGRLRVVPLMQAMLFDI